MQKYLTELQPVPWYPALLHLHRILVGMSVTLFVARAVGVACQHQWPQKLAPRWGSFLIDTLLMTAGVVLWWLMQHHPLREPWLGVKLVLLLVYIVFGSYGLKRGNTRTARVAFSMLAVLVVLQMFWIARTRHPLGLLTLWFRP